MWTDKHKGKLCRRFNALKEETFPLHIGEVGNWVIPMAFLINGIDRLLDDAVHCDDAFVITKQAKQPKKSYSLLLDSLNKLVKFTSLFILPLGAILFYQSYVLKGLALEFAVTTTSAVLLGLLPKGLLLLTSVSLALGVIRLGERQTLVCRFFLLSQQRQYFLWDRNGTVLLHYA